MGQGIQPRHGILTIGGAVDQHGNLHVVQKAEGGLAGSGYGLNDPQDNGRSLTARNDVEDLDLNGLWGGVNQPPDRGRVAADPNGEPHLRR